MPKPPEVPFTLAKGYLTTQTQLEQAVIYGATGLPTDVINSVALWIGMRSLHRAVMTHQGDKRRDYAQKVYNAWREATEGPARQAPHLAPSEEGGPND